MSGCCDRWEKENIRLRAAMVRLEDAEKGDMEPQTFNRTVTRLNAEVAAITAERDAMKREIASLRKEITDWSQK